MEPTRENDWHDQRVGSSVVSSDWTIEPGFRDTKDLRFGMGLSVLRIADPQRRDRLLLLNAFAIVLMTLLGAAGESLGMDRHLKVNTAKHRTHSLFRQGCMLYELIPNMPDARLRPLVVRFHEYLSQHETFNQSKRRWRPIDFSGSGGFSDVRFF
ncbi:hypothetical protein [Methylocystis suflitae]|uniref:hypothetical protein n=1 Tax=Methylocystis suflitae TaxID=2951405 RepID=UPI0038992D39